MRPIAGWLTDRIGRLRVLWFGSTLMVVTVFLFLLLYGTYDEMKYWMGITLFLRGTAFAAFIQPFLVHHRSIFNSKSGTCNRNVWCVRTRGTWPGSLGSNVCSSITGFPVSSQRLRLFSLTSLIISAILKEKHVVAAFEEGGWAIIKSVTFSARNLIILPGAFVFGFVVASYNTFGAPYFTEMGVTTGSFFLAYGLTAGAVRVIFGGAADRYQRWKLVSIFFALQATGLSMLLLQPFGRYYLFAGAVSGGAHGILFPSLSAMAIDAHPQKFRGVVASFFTGMMESGSPLALIFLV